MARTHEVPNHLNVQDTLFLGLTARQVATFMAFASPAYGIWDQMTIAPVLVRGAFAGLVVLAGIAFTLLQPGGRPLDDWAFAVFAYAITPRRMRWHHPPADPREWGTDRGTGWVDLAPRLGWPNNATDSLDDEERRS